MNYKNYFLALAITCSVAHNSLDATHVVVIDGEKIAQESKLGKSTQTKLTKEQEKLSAPLKKQQIAIEKMDKEYTDAKKALEKEIKKFQGKGTELLSPEAKEKEADKLQNKNQRLQEMEVQIKHKIQQFQENGKRIEQKFAVIYEKEMTKFGNKMQQAIDAAAKKENWDIAIMKGATAYYNPSADQTQVVIKLIDKDSESTTTAPKSAQA